MHDDKAAVDVHFIHSQKNLNTVKNDKTWKKFM